LNKINPIDLINETSRLLNKSDIGSESFMSCENVMSPEINQKRHMDFNSPKFQQPNTSHRM